MSTILNALRRVERNRLKDDRRIDLMHGLMNREQVVPKKKSRWMAAFTGALLCIFISLVTLVLSGYFNKEEGSIGEKTAVLRPAPPTTAEPTPRSPLPMSPASRHPVEPESNTPDAGIQPASGSGVAPDVEKTEKEASKRSHNEEIASSSTTTRSGSAPAQARQQVERRSQNQAEGPDLDISAIVWSPVPSDRFAMINSRLVREGDTVKGARIEEVFEDGIRVHYKGATFTLKTTTY